MNISKYFWDLNQAALKETKKILRDKNHAKFIQRMVALLSRCDKPKELFSIIPKKDFMSFWPKIRSYWMRRERESVFRDWWQAVYEQLLTAGQIRQKKPKEEPVAFFRELGSTLKEARIEKGLTQKQLASIIGMKQPDISKIEEGRKNITLYSLMRLCKILSIKQIDIS
ncbi:helix-turn-helix domain-containing protein [Candidatus Omnitrophota bacterium]